MQQEAIEQIFSKRNRKDIILAELTAESWFNKACNSSLEILQEYFQKVHSTPEKTERVHQAWADTFHEREALERFIEDIFVTTSQTYINIPLVSVAAILAHHIPNVSKRVGILTMAEILSLLSEVNLYDLYRGPNHQVCMKNRINLDKETKETLNKLMYLPPMISEPKIVTKNRDSYHYSLKSESMILGEAENYHEGNIGLDVMNTLSQQALKIDEEFIKLNPPTKPEGTIQLHWDMYLEQLDYVHSILRGNEIFIPYKPDKRGRFYSQGYHANTQGDDYHKAVIELATKHYIQVDDPR